MAVALWYSVKSGKLIPPAPFFLSQDRIGSMGSFVYEKIVHNKNINCTIVQFFVLIL